MTDHNDIHSIRPWRTIERRKCRQITVGKVKVGGDAPIAVQSMTNTVTHDVAATVDQVLQLQEAGADIVRVSVPDPDSSAALKRLSKKSKSRWSLIFTFIISAVLKRRKTARPVFALTLAILADKTASKKSSPRRVIMAVLSVLA